MSALKRILESEEDLTNLELTIWWVADDGTKEALMLAEDAANELVYLQACAAAVEDLSRIDAKKLAKLKVTK